MFANLKNTPIFAAEFLSLEPTSSALIDAAFFVSKREIDSIDCCTLKSSRFISAVVGSNDGVQQSFFINLILYSQMEPTVKNAIEANNSTLKSTPRGATSAHVPAITIRAGKVTKPKISFWEVLNFIERANRRQSRIMLNAMRNTAWYVPNQVEYAFEGVACKDKGGVA